MSDRRFPLPMLAALLAGAVLAAGCSRESAPASEPVIDAPPVQATPAELAAHIPGFKRPRPNLLTGGQPDARAWPTLARHGVGTVINLRTPAEMAGRDEAAEAAAAGMDYLQIPVAGAADITPDNARRLWQAVAAADGKVLVHCASGNRVGALLAVGAARERGLPVEDAIAFGRSAGLTSLEPRVRQVLAAQPED